MALTYTELSAVTEKYFVPKLVDNIFASNPLFQRTKKKGRTIDGGERIMVPLLYATTTAAGWYSGADTLNTTNNDQVTAAEFTWTQMYANITIQRIDELKNSGKAQIVNLVKAKVQAAEKTMANTMGTALFNTGSSSSQIAGLRMICAITGTYGGIAKGTYSWWQAKQDTSTAIISIPALQGLWGDCSVDNDTPTLILSCQDYLDDYYNLLQPQQRFQDSETAKGGFKNLLFNGAPWIVDSHAPTSANLFMVNENYLEFVTHKDENFRFEPFVKPINQNVSCAKIFWAGQYTCSNCRMQGEFTNLT